MTREERGEIAVRHKIDMDKRYAGLIKASVDETKIFEDKDFVEKDDNNETTVIKVIDSTTEKAIHTYGIDYQSGLTVLNFASFTNPGGGFYSGSITQEEALCHDSYLYNVLIQFQRSFYDVNKNDKCYPYYKNRALYSPNILFGEKYYANVITCAAPNISHEKFKMDWDYVTYKTILDSRIDFVLKIAANTYTKTLVLGAFGCGVFGNDPQLVAELFKKNLQKYYFEQVIFAIPNKGNDNYEVFKKVFEN